MGSASKFARRARGLSVLEVKPELPQTCRRDVRAMTFVRLVEALNTSPGWLLDERPIATVPPCDAELPISPDELIMLIGAEGRSAPPPPGASQSAATSPRARHPPTR